MAAATDLTDDGNSKTVFQPLDPQVRHVLDSEYVALHDSYLQYIQPDDALPWDSVQARSRRLIGGSEPVPVAQTRDIQLNNFSMRVFWPRGDRPTQGLPVLLWFHGGGWAIGSVESENDFCTRMCRGMFTFRLMSF